LPQEFCDRLRAALGSLPREALVPWPASAEIAFVLTHDVETADGMRRIARLAAMEEDLGFRSSWNIVPHKYPIDAGLLRDLQRRGFEIGIHGYNHDGRLYASEAIFRRRAAHINAALRRYGAVGFRSPMVHRNLVWLQQLDIAYDASYFDIDPFQAMPGGVGSLWPFTAGKFVELPYTLPQDHTLFITLAQRDVSIWRKKLAFIAGQRGMALMLTHPDYLDTPRRLDLYREFLLHARQAAALWHALPCEVAQWWRSRKDVAESIAVSSR
jgi:peptidoglycan/xylan/chitin deacetylase (PgdA/CDA1 family)